MFLQIIKKNLNFKYLSKSCKNIQVEKEIERFEFLKKVPKQALGEARFK